MPSKKSSTENQSSTATPNFEESIDELQQIVSQLEAGALSLEESMAQFERGVGLLRNCYQVLEHAEQRIEILTKASPNEQPVTEPFDAAATLEEDAAPQRQPTRRAAAKPSAGQLFGE
jgi:exodeoxyribonuclease VII small subunit